jgi:chromosome segregation ATPase
MALQSTREDQNEELETLRNVKGFLTQKLKQNEEILKSLQKDIVLLNQDLQKEKRTNLQITEKYMEMENERESYQENIKDLNIRYENVVGLEHDLDS